VPADAATCSRAFAGTPLEGYEVVDGNGGTLRVRALSGERLLELWQPARDAVEQTGRWPVAVWDEDDPWVDDPDDAQLASHAAAADPWPLLHFENDLPVDEEELRRFMRYRFPQFPRLADRVVAELGLPTVEPAYDRWVYDRVLADADLRAAVDVDHLRGTRAWHPVHSFALVLLPTADWWLAPAWLSYHGAMDPPLSQALSAAEREWHGRWGAELVASWGTMLQMIVRRPPQDPEDCWELAGQLKDVGGSLQMYRYELALALPGSDAWFLHDRP
jgi:hypothetical protein